MVVPYTGLPLDVLHHGSPRPYNGSVSLDHLYDAGLDDAYATARLVCHGAVEPLGNRNGRTDALSLRHYHHTDICGVEFCSNARRLLCPHERKTAQAKGVSQI